jgi:hypothetical protein
MQTSNSMETAAAPWYAHRWPWLLMLGPFLVLLAGGYTMWLATVRQDALVVGDYYRQGKAINQDLRRDRAASRLGLSLTLSYDASGGRLLGALAGAERAPQGPMTLRLVHSTRPEKDIVLPLVANAEGKFAVSLPMLEMARWQVLLEDQQRSWRLNGVWPWPQQATVALSALQP